MRRPDGRAETRGRADSSSVLAVRSSAGAFPKFSENGQLAAVNDGDVGELDAEFRSALYAASFADVLHLADDGLAAAGYYPTVNNERLIECGGELSWSRR